MAFEIKDKYNVSDLVELVALLRGEGGCPWDREQTHESIRRNFLEEAYEVAEAIDEKDPEHLKEELGDVLLQVVFHAGIETDAGNFTIDDAADEECRKMIFRHPHIFADATLGTSGEVLEMWDDVKKKEKHFTTKTDELRAVARSLPGTWRAEKLQKKAAKAGFPVGDTANALLKIKEAAKELENGGDAEKAVKTLLFEAVNAARLSGLDPEEALTDACDEFLDKFASAERSGKI